MDSYYDFDHDEYAKSCSNEDFWGQIRRTVNGKAVDNNQIDMITEAIVQNMQLNSDDKVIDLCCGNGALTNCYSNKISAVVGIDSSKHLIKIANQFFQKDLKSDFVCGDALDALKSISCPEQFTKVLCYGSFSYFDDKFGLEILKTLHKKFPNVRTVFLGNLPDINKHQEFFVKKMPPLNDLKLNTTSIGVWRSEEDITDLCSKSGWNSCFSRMPNDFYGSNFRFDCTLSRKK